MLVRLLRILLPMCFLGFVLVLSTEAWARAGGGGSSSSSRSSSPRTSGPRDGASVALEFGIHVLLPLGALLHIAFVNHRINKRRKEISKALAMMSQRESEWSESRLNALVREKVLLLQKSWSELDLDTMREHLHPLLYPYWESQINQFKAQNARNLIEHFKIDNLRFVAIGNFLNNEDDRFTVCIDAQCVEYNIPLVADGNSVFNGLTGQKKRPKKFREFWTFEREKNDWKLREISQFSAWTRFIRSEIIYELKNGPKPRFDVPFRTPISHSEKESGVARIFLAAVMLPALTLPFFIGKSSQFLDFESAVAKFLLLAVPISYFLFHSVKNWFYKKLDLYDVEQMFFGMILTSVIICCLTISVLTLKFANKYLDWSEGVVIRDTIMDKEVSDGRRRFKFYSVGVIPRLEKFCCDKVTGILNFSVDEDTYSRAKVGRTEYRMLVKLGLLGIPWVSQFEIIPETLSKGESHAGVKGKSLSAKELDAVKHWNPEIPNNQTNDFRVTNWSSGALKSKEPLLDGQVHGVATFRFENGQLYGQIPFKHGEKHGRFKLHRENGIIDQELSYKEGRLHGVCRWYDNNGKLKQEELYRDGELIR